jgi:type I restriction enzyme R subunit
MRTNILRDLLAQEVAVMRQTDMAAVISQAQNEVGEMVARGLDIGPHRKRMIEEKLEDKFKDAQDPLRIAFVCSMWTTGFDVPSCSTIYVDKPMRNQTLMQTITRANRVFPGKNNGLIVGYVEILGNLRKALAIYASTGELGNSNSRLKRKRRSSRAFAPQAMKCGVFAHRVTSTSTGLPNSANSSGRKPSKMSPTQ